VIDRKRKFLDTDLAHDSEGSEAFPSYVVASSNHSQGQQHVDFSPILSRTNILILGSSVFNSRVVSGSQSTSRGLVS
jgi:hypothetical protein